MVEKHELQQSTHGSCFRSFSLSIQSSPNSAIWPLCHGDVERARERVNKAERAKWPLHPSMDRPIAIRQSTQSLKRRTTRSVWFLCPNILRRGGIWAQIKADFAERRKGCKALLPLNRPTLPIYLGHYSAAVKRIHVFSPLSHSPCRHGAYSSPYVREMHVENGTEISAL